VQRFHFNDFLSRFDAQGELSCACGKRHRIQTRTAIVSVGAIEESAALLARTYGSSVRLWVLSDDNTEAAAAARWKSAVRTARTVSRVLPGRPRLHPTDKLVDRLAAEVREHAPALLIAVGSGVISDLVKRVSLITQLPNWCVATAPSVDAYSSATAAITVNGFHGALPARVSEVIACDLDVMRAAPREMFLAGLGDLLAKLLAHLDWNMSRVVTGEEYCPLIAATALDSARSALSSVPGLGRDDGESARTLTDAALSSGFAMQAGGGSRSAASAEHTMAHFWESTHAAHNSRFDLHGILAGAASRMVLPAYRSLYERLRDFQPDATARLRAYGDEPAWGAVIEEGVRPFWERVKEEMAGRRLDSDVLAAHLEAFRAGRAEILGLAHHMLSELGSAVQTLEGIGFPFSLIDLGIDAEAALLPFRNVRLLRRRYSSFDLAYELGLEGVLRKEGERYVEAEN
jgi:glycerol-1-phosphate dehydrogenase [NAD(P)+]